MTIADMPAPMPRYKFTRAMYDQMVDAGILEDQHVELIDGEIVQMSPINNPHVGACSILTRLMYKTFGTGAYVRVQAPLAIGESEPQPDVAVVTGTERDYDYHPSTAKLVIEVAETSLRQDRGVKAQLYAAAKIADYWILNLRDGQLEVYRSPKRDRTQRFGYRYTEVRILKKSEFIVPLAAKGAAGIKVADMLP
jgi:Uma2 family endonuclease